MMKTLPDLTRVFTVGVSDLLNRSKTQRIGLVFYNTVCMTHGARMALLQHPLLRSLFHDFFFGVDRDKNSIFVTADGGALARLPEDTSFYIVQNNNVVCATKADIFKRCVLLQKWQGCYECVWSPERCIHTFRPPLFPEENPAIRMRGYQDVFTRYYEENALLTWDKWQKDKRQTWKHKLADYVYIPPSAVDKYYGQPGRCYPMVYTQMDFTDLAARRTFLSLRSRSAYTTREFKLKQCNFCIFANKLNWFKRTSSKRILACQHLHNCAHGAWTEDDLTAYTLKLVKHTLAKRSRLTMNHAYIVACNGGMPFRLRDEDTGRYREWYVKGLCEDYRTGQVAIEIRRKAATKRDEYKLFPTLVLLRNYIQLHKNKKDTMILNSVPLSVTDLKQRRKFALWLHATALRYKRYTWFSRYGPGYSEETIQSVVLSAHGVHILHTNSKRTARLYIHDFTDFQDLFSDLTLFSVHDKRTEDGLISF